MYFKDKLFKCEKCNKGYVCWDNLNDYMWIYIGNYSYMCWFCDKGFFGFYKLKKYMWFVYWIEFFLGSGDNYFFIMVFLIVIVVFGIVIFECVKFVVSGGVLYFFQDEDDFVFFLFEEILDVGDEEVFDGLGFESVDEVILEEEGIINEGELEILELD